MHISNVTHHELHSCNKLLHYVAGQYKLLKHSGTDTLNILQVAQRPVMNVLPLFWAFVELKTPLSAETWRGRTDSLKTANAFQLLRASLNACCTRVLPADKQHACCVRLGNNHISNILSPLRSCFSRPYSHCIQQRTGQSKSNRKSESANTEALYFFVSTVRRQPSIKLVPLHCAFASFLLPLTLYLDKAKH